MLQKLKIINTKINVYSIGPRFKGTMTLSMAGKPIMKLSITTFSLTTQFKIVTLSIIPVSQTTLNILCCYALCRVFLHCFPECRYAERRYVECRGAVVFENVFLVCLQIRAFLSHWNSS
jgi:hypothetical protein